MEKKIEHPQGGTIYSEWVRKGHKCERKMCRKLTRKYKLNKENIIRMKETVNQRMQLKAQRMQRYEKHGKLYWQNVTFKNDINKLYREIWEVEVTVNKIPAINAIENVWDTI